MEGYKMPDQKEQYKKEWDAICNGQPVITVGFFDDDGNVCEINEVDVSEVDALDQIASDMDLRSFYNSTINC